jgi:hypothetical protein
MTTAIIANALSTCTLLFLLEELIALEFTILFITFSAATL